MVLRARERLATGDLGLAGLGRMLPRPMRRGSPGGADGTNLCYRGMNLAPRIATSPALALRPGPHRTSCADWHRFPIDQAEAENIDRDCHVLTQAFDDTVSEDRNPALSPG